MFWKKQWLVPKLLSYYEVNILHEKTAKCDDKRHEGWTRPSP
jgi:hypothetical protein